MTVLDSHGEDCWSTPPDTIFLSLLSFRKSMLLLIISSTLFIGTLSMRYTTLMCLFLYWLLLMPGCFCLGIVPYCVNCVSFALREGLLCSFCRYSSYTTPWNVTISNLWNSLHSTGCPNDRPIRFGKRHSRRSWVWCSWPQVIIKSEREKTRA